MLRSATFFSLALVASGALVLAAHAEALIPGSPLPQPALTLHEEPNVPAAGTQVAHPSLSTDPAPSAPDVTPPSTKTPAVEAQATTAPAPVVPSTPQALLIPSIGLNDPIVPVGLTPSGAMAVPSGSTNHVGWYRFGTVPGTVGSAVIDAHVFAAFAKLDELHVGDTIVVKTATNQTLRFIVQATQTYALAAVPADLLFNRADQARLNLITCAGQLTPDHSTYDHRLVVYAVLAP